MIEDYNNGDKIKIFLNVENLENIYYWYFYKYVNNLILKNIYVFSKITILQYNISIGGLTYYC